MSDRRPEKPLWVRANPLTVIDPIEYRNWRQATSDQVLAAVRRGVESGTIEGGLDALVGEVGLRLLRYERAGGTLTVERVTTTILNVFDGRLVIPVDGEET